MSKGSRQRPVDRQRFSENWDRIFKEPKREAKTKRRNLRT